MRALAGACLAAAALWVAADAEFVSPRALPPECAHSVYRALQLPATTVDEAGDDVAFARRNLDAAAELSAQADQLVRDRRAKCAAGEEVRALAGRRGARPCVLRGARAPA